MRTYRESSALLRERCRCGAIDSLAVALEPRGLLLDIVSGFGEGGFERPAWIGADQQQRYCFVFFAVLGSGSVGCRTSAIVGNEEARRTALWDQRFEVLLVQWPQERLVPLSQLCKLGNGVQPLPCECACLRDVQGFELRHHLEEPVSVCAMDVPGEVIQVRRLAAGDERKVIGVVV